MSRYASPTLHPAAGVGLRSPHVAHVLAERPAMPWFEVHSENYFADGGPAVASLERVREHYPISLHGVGLALGSCAPLDRSHVAKLVRLARRIEPSLISEHLSWGRTAQRHYNELLPLPYTGEALDLVCARIDEVQQALGRRIAIENIAAYVTFEDSTIPEPEFLCELAVRTRCGLVLDLNNIYVNARNHGGDARRFVNAVTPGAVEEIHLAGFDSGGPLLIDTHGHPVGREVWALYEHALERMGPKPTLIEWDTDIPSFDVLAAEAAKAQRILEARRGVAA